jgi:hypothetical protein
MPNWCSNRFELQARSDVIDHFIEQYCPDGAFRFSSVIPAEKTVYAQTAAWGTKWDLVDDEGVPEVETVEINGEPSDFKRLTLQFSTAWSPPLYVMDQIWNDLRDHFASDEDFNDAIDCMKLVYLEEGNDVGGVWENGATMDDIEEARRELDTYGTAYLLFKLPHEGMTTEAFEAAVKGCGFSISSETINDGDIEEVDYPWVSVQAFLNYNLGADEIRGLTDEQVEYDFGEMNHPGIELVRASVDNDFNVEEADPLASASGDSAPTLA